MKFVDPTNDVAFKKIFGNEQKKEVLISFLNAVLDLSGEKVIEDVEILNPYQAPRIEGLKYTLLDVRALDKRGITFIVEMQVENVAGYKQRFLYYAAKAYSDQIERGEDYPRLNQVIFIGILDFVGFEGDKYLSRHLILNQETLSHEITDLELNFVELPKFTKSESELVTILDKWLYFIKNAADLSIVPENSDVPGLQSAYEIANRFSWSKDEMEVYNYWGIKAQDRRGALQVATEKAMQRGLEAGMEQGLEQGLEQGKRDERINIARTMIAQGMDINTISTITNLSVEKITKLQT